MAWQSALVLGAANGLVWGFILALIALGLTLVFGVIRIINVAHGDLYMLGAVIGWYIIGYTGNFWLALLLVPVIMGGVGLVLERSVLRPIEDKAILTIIATFGVSLIFQQSVLAVFGGAPQRIAPPFNVVINLYGYGYDVFRIFVAGCSALALAALWLFLYKTRFGTWIRAVRQDRDLALGVGIPTDRIYLATFGLGSALAALGGVLAAPIVALDFQMGIDILPSALMVVIIGGLGSLQGSLLAAVLLGELEGVASVFVTPTTAKILQLLAMSLVLLLRPHGLFGRKA
jgi:branched-chain amino acid transport system permease protein